MVIYPIWEECWADKFLSIQLSVSCALLSVPQGIPITSYRDLTWHSSFSFNKANPCSCQTVKQLKVLLWRWGWFLQVFLLELWVCSISAFPDTCLPPCSRYGLAPQLQKCCQLSVSTACWSCAQWVLTRLTLADAEMIYSLSFPAGGLCVRLLRG